MNSKVTNKQLAISLYEATMGLSGDKLKKVLRAFAALLAQEHMLKKADNILKEYIKYAKMQEGIKEIEITAARELDEKTLKNIKKIFGEKVEASVKLDENLLGGVRIKTDDRILDASLRTQLNKLKQSII